MEEGGRAGGCGGSGVLVEMRTSWDRTIADIHYGGSFKVAKHSRYSVVKTTGWILQKRAYK